MALRVTDPGGQWILGLIGAQTVSAPLFVHLFTDVGVGGIPPTLLDTDTVDSREFAAGGGYVSKNLLTPAVANGADGIPILTWAQLEWIFTGPLTNISGKRTVQGYAVFEGTTGKLVWEELLDAPYTPQVNGDTLRVNVKLKLGNGTPA